MKIKIIAGKGKWYEKLIGKVRIVKGVYENRYYVLRNYRTLLRSVNIEDAELIK